MAKNYPDYDDLREQYDAGNISAVDFVTQQSDELTEEYEQFCKDKSLDTGSDQSALAFMDYRDELFHESLSNYPVEKGADYEHTFRITTHERTAFLSVGRPPSQERHECPACRRGRQV